VNGSVIKVIVNPMKHTTNNRHYICTVYTVWWHSNGRWLERNLGRPRTTWRRTVEKERSTLGWRSWGQARTVTHDRARWRRCIDTLCADMYEDKIWKEVYVTHTAATISRSAVTLCVRHKQLNSLSLWYC